MVKIYHFKGVAMIDAEMLLSRLEKMGPAISKYSKAKAERVYIENYRKSLKAILMGRSTGKTVSDREQEAYSSGEYLELLLGLKQAVEVEEKHKWSLERLKMDLEVWRSVNANERYQKDRV
jgi:hypothetical protein